MKVYVFGNWDLPEDNKAIRIADKLKEDFPLIKFKYVKPNEDLPFENQANVVILDTVFGIKKVEILGNDDLNRLSLSSQTTVHDFDLGFQLKYLQKLGKLGKIKIIGIPGDKKVNYLRIHSIFKKLVAQDMQGS